MKYVLLLFLCISVVVAGCNIFSWSSSKKESHLEKGLELMRQGNYEEAEEEFALSKAEDPAYADARYYHAKAVFYSASFDIIDLIEEVTQEEGDRKQDDVELPLYSIDIPLADETYRVNLIIIEDLSPIYSGDTHGAITAEDIDVDLAVAYLIAAILGLRDTNRDSTITEDDLMLDIEYSSTLNGYSIAGLEQFLGGGLTPRLHHTTGTPINPNQINPLINHVLDLIEHSEDLVVSIIQELTEETDIEAIQTLIDDIRTTIVKYYYDDNMDNDGDTVIDEETLDGLDNDGDGYYDEDTDHV